MFQIWQFMDIFGGKSCGSYVPYSLVTYIDENDVKDEQGQKKETQMKLGELGTIKDVLERTSTFEGTEEFDDLGKCAKEALVYVDKAIAKKVCKKSTGLVRGGENEDKDCKCCFNCKHWHIKEYIHCQCSGPWGGNIRHDENCVFTLH